MLYSLLGSKSVITLVAASIQGLTILVLTILGLSQPVQAQVNSGMMEETVVTGTRTEKTQLNAPVRVEVVSREQIEKLHAKDLKDALSQLPGLDFQDIRGRDGAEVWIQGVDAKRVKILIDNESISGAKSGGFDVQQIGVADIERIEVVKGATSALYGSDAIGGVINVITRKPRQGLEYQLRAQGGSHLKQNPDGRKQNLSTYYAGGGLAWGGDDVYAQISANYNDSKGFQLVPLGDPKSAWRQHGPAGYRASLEAKAGLYIGDGIETYVGLSHYDQDLSYRYWVVKVPFEKQEKVQRDRYRFGTLIDINEHHYVALRVMTERYLEQALEDSRRTTEVLLQREGQVRDSRASAQWDWALMEGLVLTQGLEYYRQYLDLFVTTWDEDNLVYDRESEVVELGIGSQPDKAIPSAERDGFEYYAQLDMQWGQWEILPGIRVQDDSRFGEDFTAKVNARYDLTSNPHSFFRMGLGQGYRVPNVQELYYKFNNAEAGYRIYGNSELRPESSTSVQFSWFRQFAFLNGSQSNIEISLFYNRIDDMIDTTLYETTGNASNDDQVAVYRYENFGNTRIQGVEIANKLQWSDAVYSAAAYTWLDSQDLQENSELPQRPKHQIKLSLAYDNVTSGFNAGVFVTAQSEEYLDRSNSAASPPWEKVDVKFNQTMDPWLSGLSLYAGVNNVLAEQRKFNGIDFRPKESRYVYFGFMLETP
jgi:outer membrane receptor for ferrienterochelin and colicins